MLMEALESQRYDERLQQQSIPDRRLRIASRANPARSQAEKQSATPATDQVRARRFAHERRSIHLVEPYRSAQCGNIVTTAAPRPAGQRWMEGAYLAATFASAMLLWWSAS